MARRRKLSKESVPVESLRHKDKRTNIPTRELAGFIVKEEQAPYELLYPRDPSLDPQLVWKGKDEQDRQELSVPTVPVYIQEKIAPKVIIENLRLEQKRERVEPQANLFSDFNGIEFEKLIEFYKHEQNWSNRMILGDSLLVMNSLAQKEGLKGKVQMIYLDPPYGIKFGSNWQVSTKKRDVKDGKLEDATREPEQIKAFRDTWELGIHSYLTYLRDRLTVARELLTETGSIFVQIGDENVHLVRCLMDEVFGSENFVAQIYFVTTSGRQEGTLDRLGNYVLWFAKELEHVKFRRLFLEKPSTENEEISLGDLQSQGATTTGSHPVTFQGKYFYPIQGNHWKVKEEGIKRVIFAGRVQAMKTVIRFKRFASDFSVRTLADVWTDTSGGAGTDKIYVVQTSAKVIERCMLMTTDPGDLVLDPTCGSGTTAYVAEQWGRRWITIDTSRVALALARTRLMSAKYPYYHLADSPEGLAKEVEITGKTTIINQRTEGDIKKGFVYKRVPHVTLKSIANNEEIDVIHAQWQEKMEPLRKELNRLLKQDSLEEWQIPREADKGWSEKARQIHAEWWKMRLERQKEIDESIAKHADMELLYDQPYEDTRRIRVTGPFTVESLSPHRVLAPDQSERPKISERHNAAENASLDSQNLERVASCHQGVSYPFETMILENLKKAGVQNTIKNERLTFDSLEPYAGVYIQGEGEYTESGMMPHGKSRRVAVCIGPEHGTVSKELVQEAAKEAVKGIGFDLLVVCGFAFDPYVNEEAKRFGKLTVLITRMNPDLAMGDELLKKTGSGNLFMVFGEPDVEIIKQKDGKIVVEIKGVDVYDPTTGQIRSHSTDDIACWFIDTDYNEESFFVRHAYFCGADQPYEKLKKALKAEINEEAWSDLYSTKSRPFDPPKKGKIAIKVINPYGDEVLKVFQI